MNAREVHFDQIKISRKTQRAKKSSKKVLFTIIKKLHRFHKITVTNRSGSIFGKHVAFTETLKKLFENFLILLFTSVSSIVANKN